jgi:hypothetical protein
MQGPSTPDVAHSACSTPASETCWQLAEDAHGFLLTGSNIPEAQLDHRDRMPLFLETSRPGVFAVGDVRSGSRAATAIGEGSMAVRLVFERLQATGSAVADPPRAGSGHRRARKPANPSLPVLAVSSHRVVTGA